MTENRFVMVSERMSNGNINEFASAHADANRLELVGFCSKLSFPLITENYAVTVASGCYQGFDIHARAGDNPRESQGGTCSDSTVILLYPDLSDPKVNILIDNNGRACLANFGLLTIISDEPTVASAAVGATTAQWMSPELLDPESFGLKDSRPTKPSDRYALGMVIYEVLGGQAPFAHDSFLAVASKVVKGERPERPQGAEGELFTDNIWQMLELCWKPQPRDRINAQGVLLVLVGNPCPSGPTPNASGDGEMDVDDWSDVTFGDSLYVPFVSSQIHL